MDYLENWREEKQSAYLYAILARNERTEARKKLFIDLEHIANKQAEIWENELKIHGGTVPFFKPSLRTLLVAQLLRLFDAKRLRIILSAMKVRGMAVFSEDGADYPYSTVVAHHERRHKGFNAAGNLRASVFGINDGLISNMSLVLGVAGANVDQQFILLSGIAGLLAGACSMAAGEYISVRSQQEFFEYQIEIERSELNLYPEEEAKELSVIYQARGLPKEDADRLAKLIISQPDKALDTLAREELGINPNELGSPWGAAIFSFLSFGIGATIPLIPFLITRSEWNLLTSIILTSTALFSIGALISLFTSRSAFKSGLRMLMIGAVAGCLTYIIGHWVGISVG